MIDCSIQLLWADQMDNEVFADLDYTKIQKADSGPARRLEILIAEACAAGVPWRTLAQIFLDWVSVGIRSRPLFSDHEGDRRADPIVI